MVLFWEPFQDHICSQALIKTNRFRYPRKHLSSEETLYNACLRVEYIDEELSVKGQVLLTSKESQNVSCTNKNAYTSMSFVDQSVVWRHER